MTTGEVSTDGIMCIVVAIVISLPSPLLPSFCWVEPNASVVIWDLEKKEAVCGSQAAMQSAGPVYALAFCNTRDDLFVTGGNHTLRVWELSPETRKIVATDCNLGQLKRIVHCIQIAPGDDYMFCGTSSGDVLQVNLSTRLIQFYGPQKNKLSCGIQSLQLLPNGGMLVGSGEGTLTTLLPSLKRTRTMSRVSGTVSSIALSKDSKQFYVGTGNSQRYVVELESFSPQLISSSHCSKVTDVCFPQKSSDLFATSSYSDVRVWHADTGKELLRLSTPNVTCHAVAFTPNGKAIITAWDDGKIRAFYPQSGKPMYTISDAHNKGVTALACMSDSRTVISGGGEGQVRVWEVNKSGQHMTAALKEHTGTVTCIKLRNNDEECVTASTDGTCIIWDLIKLVRSQVIFANTMFHAVCYRPDECQIVTAGTDRKIGYWETHDGSQIRELDGSESASINGMDVHGTRFLTGGGDKLIKVWDYDRGEVTHIGIGHSAEVTKVKVAPNGCHAVSVSVDGAILRWKMLPTALLGPPSST
ncbi:Cilia- and flagella-associated protein 52 [Geodia barretti]|uniref:Cilia- and flagella-associated protein 52 n=1 Tax=Geodia barretti TaxID=519541 RepID=A0AA35TEJ1_GEOBA|nr:Cilia- and flagella-associated protein 52 [Geodia barretti]